MRDVLYTQVSNNWYCSFSVCIHFGKYELSLILVHSESTIELWSHAIARGSLQL